jgi:hypothetical protein
MARRNKVARAGKVKYLHAERRAVAVSLRKQGLSYPKIAEAMRNMTPEARGIYGIPERYGEAQAWRDVAKELTRLEAKTKENAEAVRRLELERLDAMLAGVWSLAEVGNLDAVETVLKLQTRRARYVKGLEVPTRSEVSGVDGGPLEVVDARESLARKLARLAAGGTAAAVPGEPDPDGKPGPAV